MCVLSEWSVSVRDALSCRVSMPCPKHTLRIGRVEPAATAPHARVEWVAGVAGLARKLRAPSGTVSGQSLQKPRARFPPGSRCGLCVARVLHHSRVSLPFFDLHTAGKNSAGAPPIAPPFFQREARVASRACLRSSVMKSKKGEPSRKSAPHLPTSSDGGSASTVRARVRTSRFSWAARMRAMRRWLPTMRSIAMPSWESTREGPGGGARWGCVESLLLACRTTSRRRLRLSTTRPASSSPSSRSTTSPS